MKDYSIGIDLGGTKILSAIVDKESAEIVHHIKKKTKKEKGKDNIIKKIKSSIYELLEESGVNINNISSIGIGAAGQTDRKKGIIINAPNIDIHNLNIKEILENEFNTDVYLGNDVEVAALGEMYFGSAKDEKDFVCIFVGTGVGSCIVQDRKIRYGATGTAGEIGHIVIEMDGRKCACGAKGCLEAYASRLAIEKRIISELNNGTISAITNFMKEKKKIKTAMLKKALNDGDKLVINVLDEAAEYLSSGILSILNFYNPKKIILGGGLINGIDYFFYKTQQLINDKSTIIPIENISVERAELGDYSGVVGASILEIYRRNFLDEKNC